MPSDAGPTPPAQLTALPDTARPRLGPHLRKRFDRARGKHVLLGPESVIVLNGTAADVVALCDGSRTVADIVAELRTRYAYPVEDEVRGFLARMAARRHVTVEEAS
ncbi:MAG TPA: pyrroloquinoline quinone biosynthesis peptide chaperone PqqD [Pseudonocardia sp.]|jgi:pyrroloquinoline quinone biosynthesis protein D|uniref:pyrroloquinoline quinone biosynthesis peptide chaperone PqqD n=1 Tax=Pseudonocardia sp. TaxID=60912 RepID=UPI002B4B08B5|nr:pyrroloquinoline quinone biosynthesis peptide chaperone PqqD [Pseudonocardia sp.]HLU60293.1 pyrroloquinoline quinone biosynthesis peptide chaperone PqqD [Pseudonocardia sp.]